MDASGDFRKKMSLAGFFCLRSWSPFFVIANRYLALLTTHLTAQPHRLQTGDGFPAERRESAKLVTGSAGMVEGQESQAHTECVVLGGGIVNQAVKTRQIPAFKGL